jgi:hypothetical protein
MIREEGLENVDEKKLGKEITQKEDGRTLIYYTWEPQNLAEVRPNPKPGCQAADDAAEK